MLFFRPAAGRTALQHGAERTYGVRVFPGVGREGGSLMLFNWAPYDWRLFFENISTNRWLFQIIKLYY